MTASIANGFAHVLYTPDASTCHVGAVRVPPEYSTANPRGNTWSAHTYNVSYSDEIGHFEHCPSSTRTSTAPSPARTTRAASTRTTTTTSASRERTRCSSTSTAASRTTRTSTGPRTRTTGRARSRTRCSTGCSIRSRCCSPARRPTAAQLPEDRVRGRPAADRGGGLAGQPAVLRPDHRRELRQPAAGRAVLSLLLDEDRQLHLHVAGGRGLHSGHDRTTSAAARPPSSARCCRPCTRGRASCRSPVQQLQQRHLNNVCPAS